MRIVNDARIKNRNRKKFMWLEAKRSNFVRIDFGIKYGKFTVAKKKKQKKQKNKSFARSRGTNEKKEKGWTDEIFVADGDI